MNALTPEQTATGVTIDCGNGFEAVPNPINATIRPVSPNMKTTLRPSRRTTLLAALLIPCAFMNAQTSQGPAPSATVPVEDEDVVILSPFEVTASTEKSYTAATTLAGNRLNTQLRDIGSAVTVVTSQFLSDTGATDNASLLQYTTGTEVGGVRGNFAGVGDAAQLNEDTRGR